MTITDILDTYHVPYKVNERGYAEVFCPVCHSEHGAFHVRSGYYTCFKCGKSNSAEVLASIIGCERSEAARLLQRAVGNYAPPSLPKTVVENDIDVKMIGSALLPEHRRYLENRGFEPDWLVHQYGITGTGKFLGVWSNRIIIPVYHRNKLCSYQGRTIRSDDKIRYMALSAKQSRIQYKKLLYGLDKVRGDDAVVVVEGVFDKWRCDTACPTPHFVCSWGSSLDYMQLKALRTRKQVYFLLDPSDEDAQRKAVRYAESLRAFGVDANRIVMPSKYKDPDSMPMIELRSLCRDLRFI